MRISRRDDLRSAPHTTQDIVRKELRTLKVSANVTTPGNGANSEPASSVEAGESEFDWYYVEFTVNAAATVFTVLGSITEIEFINGYLGITHGTNRINMYLSITHDDTDAYVAQFFSQTPSIPDVTIDTDVDSGNIRLSVKNNEATSISAKFRYHLM